MKFKEILELIESCKLGTVYSLYGKKVVDDEWNIMNEMIAKYLKRYVEEKNKSIIAKYAQEYRIKNKESIALRAKEYRIKNKEAISNTEILIDLEHKITLTEKLIRSLNKEEKFI